MTAKESLKHHLIEAVRAAGKPVCLLQPFHIMVRYCSWCGRIMGFRRGGSGVTHGMCRQCYINEWSKVDEDDRACLAKNSPNRLEQAEEP